MNVIRSIALGLTAGLALLAAARAAELSTRQAAPAEYVRVCDADGSGFFYIPGTNACLRVGGLAMGEVRNFPVSKSQDYGFAAQLGTQFFLDKFAPEVFSPGDKLWIQATYEQGAAGYMTGNNLSVSGGAVNGNDFYGYGNGGVKAGNGWDFRTYDCAFGHCDKSYDWAFLVALKHYWLPTLSSGLFGSYLGLRYSGAAPGNGAGVVNADEYRIGSNLIWTPIKNFEVGGEVMYLRDNRSRPAGLAPDPILNSAGLPSWKSSNGAVEGRVRVQRAF